MAIGARLETPNAAHDLRGAPRHRLYLAVTAAKPAGQSIQVLIHNISETGLLLETGVGLEIGEKIGIHLPHQTETTALILWSSGTLFGCEFAAPLNRSVLSAAQLQSVPAHADRFDGLPAGDRETEEPVGMATTSETFGARLRRLRLARSFTLTGLAAAVGVSKPTVWKWENDEVRPRQRSLDKLRVALALSEQELLTGKQERKEQDAVAPIESMSRFSFAESIRECKERIAQLAGTQAENVTITLRC